MDFLNKTQLKRNDDSGMKMFPSSINYKLFLPDVGLEIIVRNSQNNNAVTGAVVSVSYDDVAADTSYSIAEGRFQLIFRYELMD